MKMENPDQKAFNLAVGLVFLGIILIFTDMEMSSYSMTGGLWLFAACLQRKSLRSILAIVAVCYTGVSLWYIFGHF